MGKKRERRGFTLIELMVVILIVGILAAVAVPILRGKIDDAKWSEGAATAGAIRSAARAAYAEDPTSIALGAVTGQMPVLGFRPGDLTGRYFNDTHFTITNITAEGIVDIQATAPAGSGLTGVATLTAAGWTTP
jgi:prepilin-type N-terminal cleavage/methylation domain-containing protein